MKIFDKEVGDDEVKCWRNFEKDVSFFKNDELKITSVKQNFRFLMTLGTKRFFYLTFLMMKEKKKKKSPNFLKKKKRKPHDECKRVDFWY